MPSCAQIGSGGGSGGTISSSLTSDIPGPGSIYVVYAITSTGGNGLGGSRASGVSDSRGNPGWVASTDDFPLPANASADTTLSSDPPVGGVQGPFTEILIGAVGRACSPSLLASGDSITVEFVVDSTGSFNVETCVVWLQAAFVTQTQRGGLIDYATAGRPYYLIPPETSPPYSRLSYIDLDDITGLGSDFYPSPDADCAILAIYGGYSSFGGFSPLFSASGQGGGSTVGWAAGDAVGGAVIDPGCTNSAADLLAGSFQFLRPVNPASGVGLNFWRRN